MPPRRRGQASSSSTPQPPPGPQFTTAAAIMNAQAAGVQPGNAQNGQQATTQPQPRRTIRGPHSALTDFLASQNIDAGQIRRDAIQRAAAQASAQPAAQSSSIPDDATSERHKAQQKAIDKIKASKKFKKQKKRLADSDDEDDLIQELLLKGMVSKPGQMENCDICSVRFTVTAYSKAGPNGGLLCNPCGKDLEKDDGPSKKKRKTASGGPVGRRRKAQSKMLDGTFALGAKSLASLCIETLVKNINLAEDLAGLAPHTMDKISRMISKRRLLDPETLNLFLQTEARTVAIYDCAKLRPDDLIRIFQMVPHLTAIKLRNAIQFKDEVVDYLLSRDNINLESMNIHGANLLSNEMWLKYLSVKGKSLHTLQVHYTDKHFDDECLALLKTATPSLKRLKVHHNQKVTGVGIRELGHLENLEHLSIDLRTSVHSDIWVGVLGSIGADLKTLSLRESSGLDNTVLAAIHDNCRNLSKLRITNSEEMTDAGFVRLFDGWANPGLDIVDLAKCRYVDALKPQDNPDNIGLCSEGFKALMAHSEKTIQKLNVHANRHISQQAFEEVFGPDKIYESLRELEISFCEVVTDFIVASIFRSCPNLKELNVFGCMRLKDVRVPKGTILVGMPNVLGMVIEGQE